MFFAPPPDAAAKYFDAAAAAHTKLTRVRVHVELDAQTLTSERQQSTYDIAMDGSHLLIRVRQPRHKGEDKSDRTYLFANGTLVAWDAIANERLGRSLPKGQSRLDQALYVFGTLPDLVQGLIQPSVMKTFFDQSKAVSGWSVQQKGGEVLLTRPQGAMAKPALVAIDAAKSLLRRVDIGHSGNEVHWKFDYSTPGAISLSPPSSARSVTAFTVAPEPPHYMSPAAEKTTKAMLDAHARFSGTIQIEGKGSHVTVAVSGRKLREDNSAMSYAFDGKTLTILDKAHHRFYRGVAVRSTITDLIAEVGSGADPLSRQILQRRVPFREAIVSNMKVAVVGKITSAGGPCDILSLDGGRTKVTLFVRRRDHLVDSIMTNLVDGSGRILSSSGRRFKYTLGAPSAAAFTVAAPAGTKVLPLPALKLDQ